MSLLPCEVPNICTLVHSTFNEIHILAWKSNGIVGSANLLFARFLCCFLAVFSPNWLELVVGEPSDEVAQDHDGHHPGEDEPLDPLEGHEECGRVLHPFGRRRPWGMFNVSYEHWTGSGRTDAEYIHHVALVAGEDPGAIMAMLETFDCFSRLLFRYSTAVAARTSTNGTQRVPKYHISISFT